MPCSGLGLPPLMIETPWFLGPKVPWYGMLGKHVCFRNAPMCSCCQCFVCVCVLL